MGGDQSRPEVSRILNPFSPVTADPSVGVYHSVYYRVQRYYPSKGEANQKDMEHEIDTGGIW